MQNSIRRSKTNNSDTSNNTIDDQYTRAQARLQEVATNTNTTTTTTNTSSTAQPTGDASLDFLSEMSSLLQRPSAVVANGGNKKPPINNTNDSNKFRIFCTIFLRISFSN